MNPFSVGILALCTACGSLGCSARQPPTEATRPTGTTPSEVARDLPITYRRTGGIVGVDDRIVIWEDGLAQVTNGSTVQTGVRLTSDDRDEIAAAIARCADAREAHPPVVMDAFHYRIQQGGRIIVGNDATMSQSMRDLVQMIEQLICAAAAATPDQGAE